MNTVTLDQDQAPKRSAKTLVLLVLLLVLLGAAGYGAYVLYQMMAKVPLGEITSPELVHETLGTNSAPGTVADSLDPTSPLAPSPGAQAASAAGDAADDFVVVFSSFAKAADADALIVNLRGLGIEARGEPWLVDGVPGTRVLAGPYPDLASADQVRLSAAQANYPAQIAKRVDDLAASAALAGNAPMASPTPASLGLIDSTPVPGVGAALAKSPVPGNMLSAKEIEFAVQEEDLLRQIRLMRMRVELADLQTKMSESNVPVAATQQPPGLNVIDAPQPDPLMLVSVWGREESALRADFFLKGYRRTVRAGEPLIDGWVVERVTRSGVDVRRGAGSKTERRTVVIGGVGQPR